MNGIASKDLARWVRIGRFVKYGNGVYKATQYPSSEEDPYAIAVAQCGKGAYLCGESVIGLLRLGEDRLPHGAVSSCKRWGI